MTEQIAVTGSSGYVGEEIVRFLEKYYKVFSFSRKSTSFYFDLSKEIEGALLEGVSALVHCAWDMKAAGKKEMYEINVRGSEKLFKAADKAGVKKIIFISSIAAFNGCKSYYGKTKLEVEKMTLDRGGVVIRPSLVFDKDFKGGMVKKLKAVACKAKILPSINAKIYVCERAALSETVLEAISKDWSGKIITASHPKPYSFKELLLLLAKTENKSPFFIPFPWQIMWAGLRALEALGAKAPFKSDSLISLLNPNPAPDFSCLENIKAQFKRIEEVINSERENLQKRQ